jgi:hypothetical protein
VAFCPSCGAEYRDGFTRCSECDEELGATPPAEPRIGPRWVVVATFTTPEEARFARGYLEGEGVAAEVLDLEMHVQPFGMGILGEVQVLTPPEVAHRASRLLSARRLGQIAAFDLPDSEGGGETEA